MRKLFLPRSKVPCWIHLGGTACGDRHNWNIGRAIAARRAVRPRSRSKTECKNKLKQLGIAATNHHDTQKHFPTGGWGWRGLAIQTVGTTRSNRAAGTLTCWRLAKTPTCTTSEAMATSTRLRRAKAARQTANRDHRRLVRLPVADGVPVSIRTFARMDNRTSTPTSRKSSVATTSRPTRATDSPGPFGKARGNVAPLCRLFRKSATITLIPTP